MGRKNAKFTEAKDIASISPSSHLSAKRLAEIVQVTEIKSKHGYVYLLLSKQKYS